MNAITRTVYQIEPEGIGALHQRSVAETAPLHTHRSFYEFFLVIQGKALHLINEQVELLSPGSFVIVRPWDVHGYGFYQMSDFEFYNLSLSKQEFQKITALFNYDSRLLQVLELPTSPILRLPEAERGLVQQKVESIQSLVFSKQHPLAKHNLKALIVQLFLNHIIQNEEIEVKTQDVPRWLSELVNRMSLLENFSQGLDQMIALSGYSQEHLSRSCKRYFDMTPTQLVNQLRLSHACHLMRTTDYDILSISEQCGFGNLSHFYHQFKKTYGISPKQFKNKAGVIDTTNI